MILLAWLTSSMIQSRPREIPRLKAVGLARVSVDVRSTVGERFGPRVVREWLQTTTDLGSADT